MRIIDLSHTIGPGMPVYPGTEPPHFDQGCSIDEHGFAEKRISLYTHTGTHMDAPAHMIEEAGTLDTFPLDRFFGKAFLLDLSDLKEGSIDTRHIQVFTQRPGPADFLILRTGWSQYWHSGRYYADYPVLTREAAEQLTGLGLKGLGVDAISVDRPDTRDYPVHKVLFTENMIIVENLTNLDSVPEEVFTFVCFPLRLEAADGSPVRAAALVE